MKFFETGKVYLAEYLSADGTVTLFHGLLTFIGVFFADDGQMGFKFYDRLTGAYYEFYRNDNVRIWEVGA